MWLHEITTSYGRYVRIFEIMYCITWFSNNWCLSLLCPKGGRYFNNNQNRVWTIRSWDDQIRIRVFYPRLRLKQVKKILRCYPQQRSLCHRLLFPTGMYWSFSFFHTTYYPILDFVQRFFSSGSIVLRPSLLWSVLPFLFDLITRIG